MNSCTVLIPVYNAFSEALRCLESVMLHLPAECDVLVIDDASPNGDLISFLPEALRSHPQIRILRNKVNLGFVGTCNRGMILYTDKDVVLLNSDTIVTAGWLLKLQSAMQSGEKIGTVTPLTNNGTIASVPRFLENNILPAITTIDEFASLVEKVSRNEYHHLPTCVGFCTYVSRELIEEVGGFDPEFGKGYGEENDLSLRGANAGFSNILDDSTFIYHEGSMSFKDMKDALSAGNAERLSARYPSYNNDVAHFCVNNPLHAVHARIWNAIQSNAQDTCERSVLHIIHNGPYVKRRHDLGGTEMHVQNLIENEKSSAHFSLTTGIHNESSCYYLTAHTEYGDREIFISKDTNLSELLLPQYFDLIHLHHTIGFDLDKLSTVLFSHGKYVVSMHDYWLLCNRIFLCTESLEVCDGLSCQGQSDEYKIERDKKRIVTKNILEAATRVVTFSESGKEILDRVYKTALPLTTIPHGIPLPERRNHIQPTIIEDDPIRILFMGTLVHHKGLKQIEELCSYSETPQKRKLEWYFIGDSEDKGDAKLEALNILGRYTHETLQEMIDECNPHLAVLIPQCHETYSITLDEIVWCGVPVIVNEYGALKERVNGWKIGGSCKGDAISVLQKIDELISNPKNLAEIHKAIIKAPIITQKEEAKTYSSFYAEICPTHESSSEALMSYLQPGINLFKQKLKL